MELLSSCDSFFLFVSTLPRHNFITSLFVMSPSRSARFSRLGEENILKDLPPRYSTCYASEPPPYTKAPMMHTSTSKSQPNRKSLHRHKNPHAYEDVPIFENPCPICFFKHYHKLLKQWMCDRKNPTRRSQYKLID